MESARLPQVATRLGLILTALGAPVAGCGDDDLNFLTCEPGFVLVDQVCVPDCEDGYLAVGDECVLQCEPPEVNDGGTCVLQCAEGYEVVDGRCVIVCEPGYVPYGDECLLDCGEDLFDLDGVCVPYGTLAGRVCNQALGIWAVGSEVSVELGDGSQLTATTDADGSYSIEGVPPGTYYVNFAGPGEYSNVLPAAVEPGETTTIGFDTCVPPPGHLYGAVCDTVVGVWVENATVSIDTATPMSDATDQFGKFAFFSVPPGEYTITITRPDGGTSTRTATIVSGQITDIGPEVCRGNPGRVSGRICGGDGYWLSNASVSVVIDGNRIETTTDGNGNFTLEGLQAGDHTIHVEKGSFTQDFEVTVPANGEAVLVEPECIPPNIRIAVVTGVYDKVEDVLTQLGYAVRARFANSATPTILDPSGYADVIDGYGPGGHIDDYPAFDPNPGDTMFWMDGFLMDPLWLAEYDIIFFDCGVDDLPLLTGAASSQALQNLRDFVQAGGSIYVSDWAHQIVAQAFPGRIAFNSNDIGAGPARLGVPNEAMTATVVDGGLTAALGRTSVTVNLNLAFWVMMGPVSTQAADVRVLLRANAQRCNGTACVITHDEPNIPLTVRFDFGAGRVLYTSAHNESNNTPDLEAVLNYIIFEL